MSKGNITIVGAGKVGSALSALFVKAGYTIIHVISSSEQSAFKLASHYKCTYSSDLIIDNDSQFVIVSVPDSSLEGVLADLTVEDKQVVVAHTAGSYSLDSFPLNRNYRKGIFYPLQTFTLGRESIRKEIPLFVEGDSPGTVELLKGLASDISNQVYTVNFEIRQKLHLAAVFVCNFVNHMFFTGEKILEGSGLPEGVLEPLINETFKKYLSLGPYESQTGPAMRNDKSTIEKHLDLLSYSPEWKNIYISVTESIINYYIKDNT